MAEDKGTEPVDEGMEVVPDAPLADVPTIIPELEDVVSQLATDVSFARKTWKDGSEGATPITAAELNRLEKGVADLTSTVNALRDSVSHIDAGVYIRTAAFISGATIRINGGEWQTYFLFGSSNICAIIGQRNTEEPSVVNLSGASLTAKRGPGTSINMTTTISSGVLVVMSNAPFTVTK